MYGLINYVAYCLYPPLYIAGPIMTFNDFIWQVSRLLIPGCSLIEVDPICVATTAFDNYHSRKDILCYPLCSLSLDDGGDSPYHVRGGY